MIKITVRIGLTVMAVACISMVGCRKAEEKTYEGKTESEWVRLSKDAEWFTRQRALEPLAELGRVDVLDSAARAEGNPHYRYIIGIKIFLCPTASKNDRQNALDYMSGYLQQDQDSDTMYLIGLDDFTKMVKSHPADCKPLLPVLKRGKEVQQKYFAGSWQRPSMADRWQELIDLVERE